MMKQQMSSPSPVTDGTNGVGDDRHRRAQGVRLCRQRDCGVATFRPTTVASGCSGGTPRRRSCSRTRCTCRFCTGCTPTIRPIVLRIDKATRQDDLARPPNDSVRDSNRRMRTRRRRSCGTATRPRSSSPEATSSRVTIQRPARSCGAPTASIQPTTAAIAIVASPVVHGDLLFAPSRERPLLALKPGGRGDVTRVTRAVVVQQRTGCTRRP